MKKTYYALLRGILITASLACVFGCADLYDMRELRKEVIGQLGHKNVKVILQNGNCIGVSIINSSLGESPEKQQDAARQKVVNLIAEQYGKNPGITRAWIAFVKHRNYIIFRYTNALNTSHYEKQEDGTWRKRNNNCN